MPTARTTSSGNGRATRTRAATKKAMGDLQASVAGGEAIDATTKAAKKARKSKVASATAEASIEKAANAITKVNLDISKALATVTDDIREQIEVLNELKEAIGYKQEELAELHDKDLVLSALTDLVDQYNEKKAELDAQIAEEQAVWAKNQQVHDEQIAERDRKRAIERQQEQETFEYDLDRGRRESLANLEQEIHRRKIEERDRREKADREEAARAEALESRETAVETKEAEVAQAQATAEATIDAKIKEATSKLHAQNANEVKFLKQESDAKLQLAAQEISHLQTAVQDAQTRIDMLQTEKSAMQKQIQDMAVESLKVSSGQAALKAVGDFADKTGSGKGK